MTTQTKASHFVVVLAVFAALGGLLFGYDTGVISGAMLFLKKDFHLSINAQEFVVSSMLLTATIGALLAGPTTDAIGRRKVIIAASVLFIIGAFALSLAPSYNWLIGGRMLVGLAVGFSSTAVPLYIAEIAPASHRGLLVTINQLFITIGILIAYIVNYTFADTLDGWRWMFGLAVIPALIQCIGMVFFPDSPRFLLAKGRETEAKAVLKATRIDPHLTQDIRRIKTNLHEQKGTWKELFSRKVGPALMIAVSLQVFQQLTGINTVIYYAPEIFQAAGFKGASAAIGASLGVGIVNVMMTLIALPLLDRWGRRPMLFTGLSGMIIALFSISAAFLFPNVTALKIASVIGLMVFVGSFAIGLGPMPWLIPSEILPTKVRGRASGLSVVGNWGSNFIVASFFLSMIHSIGISMTFALFGLIGILALVFFYAVLPETKDKSLEEIRVHWMGAPKSTRRSSSKK